MARSRLELCPSSLGTHFYPARQVEPMRPRSQPPRFAGQTQIRLEQCPHSPVLFGDGGLYDAQVLLPPTHTLNFGARAGTRVSVVTSHQYPTVHVIQ